MYGYIYKTTNIINGKIYIGKKKSSAFLAENYLGSGTLINKAIKKYGEINFNVNLLDVAESKIELNEKEKYWIAYYNSTDKNIGYNIAKGGDGGILWEEGHHPSLGKDRSKYNNPFYKKHHTLQSKLKMSLKKKGKVSSKKGMIRVRKDSEIKYINKEQLDDYIKLGYTNYYYEKDKERQYKIENNIPIGMKGNHQSEYQKLRASETHKGKIISEEQKEKCRKTKEAWSDDKKKTFHDKQSEAQQNLCWVTNGVETIKIHKKDLNLYLDKNYKRGRTIKNKEEK